MSHNAEPPASPRETLDLPVAVVTGGGRGIGRAVALELAAAGHRVAVIGRTRAEVDETARTIREAGGEAIALAADVTDASDVSRTFGEIVRTLGRVDVLVNNAGTTGPFGPFEQVDVDAWWAATDVNLRGPALCMRTALPGMVRARRGRIVNVSSGGAATGMAYFSSYIVSKTALVRLTEIVATEVRPFGLSVFAVGPGTVRTAMTDQSLSTEDGRRWLPWFRRIFDEGFDVSPQRAATMIRSLASGRYDALSGRFVTVSDDLDRLVSEMRTIDHREMYALRVGRLPPARPAPAAIEAINDAATRPAGLTLRLHRSLPLSIDRLFSAWIDAGSIARWFVHGAEVAWIAAPEVDPRPGGSFRLRVAGEVGTFDFTGVYRDVTSPSRLQFTWRWENIPILKGSGDTSVTIEFDRTAEGTALTLIQEHLGDEQAYEAHRRGWQRCFDGLEALR